MTADLERFYSSLLAALSTCQQQLGDYQRLRGCSGQLDEWPALPGQPQTLARAALEALDAGEILSQADALRGLFTYRLAGCVAESATRLAIDLVNETRKTWTSALAHGAAEEGRRS